MRQEETTVATLPEPPDHLLTIAEYAELGETEPGYTELLEGRLLMSPSPRPKHGRASLRIATSLQSQLPDDLEALQEIDVDLELVPPGRPGFSRRPDLILVRSAEVERAENEGGLIRASEVEIVVEIVSPGSRYTDHRAKRAEYAEAGIPHYWIVDLAEPISLIDCYKPSKTGYQDSGEITGKFKATEPFPVSLDLDALL
jgi:Uma2 family endonuclease